MWQNLMELDPYVAIEMDYLLLIETGEVNADVRLIASELQTVGFPWPVKLKLEFTHSLIPFPQFNY